MSYKVPTFEQFRSFLIAHWRAMFPTSNVGSQYAYHWKRSNAVAAVATDGNANVSSVQKEVMPDTARDALLTRWGTIFAVDKTGATPARKSSALGISGAPGSSVAIGDTLTHPPTGLRFQVDQAFTLVGSTANVDVVAIDTGSQTRLLKGQVLVFDSAPPGINGTATLVLDLDEDGFDAEQDQSYSQRVLARIGEPQAGGNATDYVAWARSMTGIAAAFCYSNRAGTGTVDVVGLHAGSGDSRKLLSGEATSLLTLLQSKAPTQVTNALRVLSVTLDPKPIEITVTPNGDPEWVFDWDDSTPPVVLSWTGATLTLQFTAARPASMLAGHRLCLKGVASAQTGEEHKIAALVSTDKVILEVAPAVAPAATDVVYSGGPMVSVIRDALCGHIDGEIVYADKDGPLRASKTGSKVGLVELAQGMGPANPGGVYGSWSGSLVRTVLSKIAVYHRGARNCSVILPAADYDAVDYGFPNDANIGLISWSSVLVRKA